MGPTYGVVEEADGEVQHGSSTWNDAPHGVFAVSSAWSVPPRRVIRRWAMDSPSPVPTARVWRYLSWSAPRTKASCRSSGVRPAPVSLTVMAMRFEPPAGRHRSHSQRVLQQTVDDLTQPVRIRVRDDLGGRVAPEFHPAGRGNGTPRCDGLAENDGDVDGTEFGREIVSLQASQLKKVGDEPVKATRLGEHRGTHLARVLCIDDAVGESFRVPAQSGERGAQVVRDGEQELPLPRLAHAQRLVELVESADDIGHLGSSRPRQFHVAVAPGQPSCSGGCPGQRA
jgi:hypothetical protein